jgi:GH24 family phage-related lysozyme (muramidase)
MSEPNYFKDLVEHEGYCTWPYLDTRGLMTTGIGNLVEDPEAFLALPWRHIDASQLATRAEKLEAYKAVKAVFEPNKPARAYRAVCDLRLADDDVCDLTNERIEREFLPGIRKLLADFDDMPEPAKRGIMDMAYNLGVHGLSKFTHFLEACRFSNWKEAAKQCRVSSSRESRNQWRIEQFEAAAAS